MVSPKKLLLSISQLVFLSFCEHLPSSCWCLSAADIIFLSSCFYYSVSYLRPSPLSFEFTWLSQEAFFLGNGVVRGGLRPAQACDWRAGQDRGWWVNRAGRPRFRLRLEPSSASWQKTSCLEHTDSFRRIHFMYEIKVLVFFFSLYIGPSKS